MTETKKILLIGRSGRGKSTLANVLLNKNDNFEEVFKESSGSVSETKKIQFEEFENKDSDINYLIIDTPGIGDTKMSDNEVLDIIAEAVYLAKDGLGQVLFVVGGRFDQSEMATYNLLRTIIFDEHITEHTTIVRTRFADFRSEKKRQADIDLMVKESQEKKDELKKEIADNKKKIEGLSSDSEEYKEIVTETEQLNKELKSTLSEIIESCQGRIVHVDNQPKVRIRKQSRAKLLDHLDKICQTDYRPEKLKELSNEIADDMDKLLQSRKELEEEMEKLKASQSSSISIQPSKVNELENISETDKKTESVDEKESVKHEQESKTEDDNLAVGEKVKELEDKRAKLKKEIAEKEKSIRQKVLKHIFNNYKEISGELGGDILMESVVGEHNWGNISPEFKDKELVLEWLNEKFDYEQVQKWAVALGKDFNPNNDVGFCIWLRDDEKLTVEKIQELDYPRNIEQLKKEYLGQLEKEVEIFDKHSKQLSQGENWTDIHKGFSEYYQQEWEGRGFTYEQTKQWIGIGFTPNESDKVKSWRKFNFTPQEVKSWIDIGLTENYCEFVAYLKWKGYQPNPDLNWKQIKENGIPAQEYLDCFYPRDGTCKLKNESHSVNNFGKKRNEITKLYISYRELQGTLKLDDFVNLKELWFYHNQLTSLDLNQNSKLEVLDIKDNNFFEQDLSFLGHLVNLKMLWIGNETDQERVDRGIYNRFCGSLEPLKNLTKLEQVYINDTDLDSGLEYLPNSVEDFCCLVRLRKDARVKIIADLFANDQGVIETQSMKKHFGESSSTAIKNFPQKLQAYKQKLQEQSQIEQPPK